MTPAFDPKRNTAPFDATYQLTAGGQHDRLTREVEATKMKNGEPAFAIILVDGRRSQVTVRLNDPDNHSIKWLELVDDVAP